MWRQAENVIVRCAQCRRYYGHARPLAVVSRNGWHYQPPPWSVWRVIRVGKGDLDADRRMARPADPIPDELALALPKALWPGHNSFEFIRLMVDGEEMTVVVPSGPGRGDTGRRFVLAPVPRHRAVELACPRPSCTNRQGRRYAKLVDLAEQALATGRRDVYL